MVDPYCDTSRNSEYGPDTEFQVPRAWRGFKLPIRGTIGDLIDATPAENRTKATIEEKVFETWYYGRTVLIGDGKRDGCRQMGLRYDVPVCLWYQNINNLISFVILLFDALDTNGHCICSWISSPACHRVKTLFFIPLTVIRRNHLMLWSPNTRFFHPIFFLRFRCSPTLDAVA